MFWSILKFYKIQTFTIELHNLMYSIANVLGHTCDEMNFEIFWKLFCYSLRHFEMITGLKREGDAKYKYAVTSGRREFAKSYFEQPARFKRKTLERWFRYMRLNDDEDALKLALVYLVTSVLLNNNPTVVLPEFFVNLVDNIGKFQQLPLGKGCVGG